jgi:hypothetical protein
MRSKSFAARKVGDVIICAHTSQAPTDAEWDEVIDYWSHPADLSRLCALVYTEGGAPDPRQRARLRSRLGDVKVRIAVLTASALARAAGVAVSWFNPAVRIFRVDDVEKALHHLDVAPAQRRDLRRVLSELQQELGLGARSVSQ